MKPTEPLTCRECGATPERRGDAIASSALAYTCSLCLYGASSVTKFDPRGSTLPEPESPALPLNPATEHGIKRRGRPRRHVSPGRPATGLQGEGMTRCAYCGDVATTEDVDSEAGSRALRCGRCGDIGEGADEH